MSDSKFFGRRAQVLLQLQGDPSPVPLLPSVPAVAVAGLHLNFRAEKDNLGHPNTLDLSIFNLSAQTRTRMQREGGYVRLEAGYAGQAAKGGDGLVHYPVLFEGNARTIDHIRKGPDWITHVQCGDGETAYRYGFLSQSFSAGTTSAWIAKALAQAIKAVDPLHIDISAFVAQADTLKYAVSAFVFGYVTHGNAFEELQKLLGGDYELSVQNGELRVLRAQEASKNVVRLAPDTGLIGSPEHGTPNANGLPSILKVQSLLNPRIHPGDLIEVEARSFSRATFRVQKLTHSGDLAGHDWQTEVEAMPLSASTLAPF